MSKLLEDLGNLIWFDGGTAPFAKALTTREWHELTEWCNNNFGQDGWYIEKNTIHTKKAEHLTLFLMRWL